MKNYESPKIKIIKIKVEKGFALSRQHTYTIRKVENGGRAW